MTRHDDSIRLRHMLDYAQEAPKMQKSIYRVRTRDHISQRIAIDMQRDARGEGRLRATTMLHIERNGIQYSW